jgi:hemerythrin
MAIEWDEKYRIGNDAIDGEHRELFGIANRFLKATGIEETHAAALELRLYTKEHFRHEEVLMREVGYPLTATHLRLHADLISKLDDIESKIQNGELHQVDKEEFINYRFIKHIAAMDAPLVVYVKRHMAIP